MKASMTGFFSRCQALGAVATFFLPRRHRGTEFSDSFPAGTLGTRERYSRQGRWQPLIRCLLTLMLLAVGPRAWAIFEFIDTVGGAIDLETYDDSVTTITHTFTVHYRACTGASCASSSQANYRLAISDDGVYNPNQLNVSRLQGVMAFNGTAPRVKPNGKHNKPITPAGGWTHGSDKGNGFDHGNGSSALIEATYTIKLNNIEELKRIAMSDDPYLRFYVNGEVLARKNENIYPFEKYSAEAVKIKLNYPPKYRVSGLRDLAMDSRDFPGQAYYSDQMDFCIHVSRDPRYYVARVWGQNDYGQFILKNGGNSVGYEVLFAQSIGELDSATPQTGPFQQIDFNGHESVDCKSYTENNAAIRVRIKKEDVPTPGIYTDTVTVMVGAT